MSDAIKIEPNTVVFYYYLWFDFYCIRRYFYEKSCNFHIGILREVFLTFLREVFLTFFCEKRKWEMSCIIGLDIPFAQSWVWTPKGQAESRNKCKCSAIFSLRFFFSYTRSTLIKSVQTPCVNFQITNL
jgi:hypothetical protein